jgi:hypothetical protein
MIGNWVVAGVAMLAQIALVQPALAQACLKTQAYGLELTGKLESVRAENGMRTDHTLVVDQPICVEGKGEDGLQRKEADLTRIILSPATRGAKEDLPSMTGRKIKVTGEFRFMRPDAPAVFLATQPRMVSQ